MTRARIYSTLLMVSLPIFVYMNLNSGPADISLLQGLGDFLKGEESVSSLILIEVRLPRSLLAICIGISLAMSGASLQGLLRNPLASPGLLGVSQSAVLAAVITLYYGYASIAWFALPVSAMAGALLSACFIFLLAGKYKSTLSLILVGVALNAMLGSLISLALNFAPNPYALQEIYFWMLGSISNRSLNEFAFAFPFMFLGWGLILSTKKFLDAMSLGEETASSLGFNLKVQKWRLIIGVASCTGAAVAVSGNIAFIGLVVPHILRPLVNYEPGKLLALSALGGALLMLLADTTVQAISTGQELQIGVVTAALGGPFFLFLVYKNRQKLI